MAEEITQQAQAGDLIERRTRIYKTKKNHYQEEYGTLIVAENRRDPAARLITIPVRLIHSSSSSPADPIFHLGGGPGQTNINWKPDDALLARHDVVLVGYRGADGFPILQGPEIVEAVRGQGPDITSPESLERIAAAMGACADRLRAEGVDLSGYTIPEVVADLEAARIALKIGKINLLSQSYGTRVAQVYALLHPEVIARSAMIGVNPPGRFVWEAGMIDHQIERYSELCAQDPACSQRTADLSQAMRRVSRAMPSRWRYLKIDPGKVRVITAILLFHRRTAALAFDAWLAADEGDFSGLALLSLAYDLAVPGIFTWGDLMAKGMNADYDPGRDYDDLYAPDSILGTPLSLLIWQPASRSWPVWPMEDRFRQPQPCEVETLLINGSLDFSTPVEYGRDELLPSLKNGRLVILAEMGHCADFWSLNQEAAYRLLTGFFASGEADASGFDYLPMDFTVRQGLPLLAKLLTYSGLLLIAIPILKLLRAIRIL